MKTGALLTTCGIVVLCLCVLAGCNSNSYGSYGSNNPPPPTNTSPNTVTISNYSFSPATLTVKSGTAVTWQNDDPTTHTSTSDNGVWDTGNINSSGSKSITFNTAGTYKYHCTYHPMMVGTIVVQ